MYPNIIKELEENITKTILLEIKMYLVKSLKEWVELPDFESHTLTNMSVYFQINKELKALDKYAESKGIKL